MELELNRTHLTGYQNILDTTVFREETLEAIVSDANPDILRLVDTRGVAFLKGKTASDGRVALTGTARLAILYLPDGGTGLCRMEVNIPFHISLEDPGIKTGCMVTAVPRICSADTRTMNPRKVVTRVEIAVDVQVFSAHSQGLCTSVTAENGVIEQLKKTHQINCVTAVQDKQVSFENQLTIPTGRAAAEELVSNRVNLACHDQKIIGNKLILKGDATVQMLYRTVNGALDTADYTLPFSQILEVDSVATEGKCRVEMALSEAEFLLGSDGRTVSVSLSMLIQVIVREEREMELLADAYSTGCRTKIDYEVCEYQTMHAEGIGRQPVREVIETGIQMKSVIDAYCQIGRLHQMRKGHELQLTAQVLATALCLTENDEYCAVSREVEVSCSVDVAEECMCPMLCHCTDVGVSPTADGVEVRFQINFPYLSLLGAKAEVVRDISLEAEEQEHQRKPSIVLRVMEDGERLWDVAKRYSTTIADIIKANNLENEQPGGGTLLLIPRKR